MRPLIILVCFATFQFSSFAQQPITFLKKQQINVPYKINPTPHMAQVGTNYVVIWDVRNSQMPSSAFIPTGAVYNRYGELIDEFDPKY